MKERVGKKCRLDTLPGIHMCWLSCEKMDQKCFNADEGHVKEVSEYSICEMEADEAEGSIGEVALRV